MSSSTPNSAAKTGRVAQIISTYRLTRETDRRIGIILLALVVLIPAVIIGGALLFGVRGWAIAYWVLLGILLGILAATFVFSRRAEKAAYSQIDGQPGAAAAVLGSLRSGWFTSPAVAITKNQDIVQRVIGKPGIILVSEGPSSRVSSLLATERKKTARWVPDIPIHEVQCGDGEGQVTLRKLNSTVMKLPRALSAGEVTAVRKRLDAVSTPPLPIPKGPLPKGGKIPKGMRG
jgi:hypothetical protein